MNAPRELPDGIVHGMASDDYHATDAVGSSILKAMRKSPAHARALTDPERPEKRVEAFFDGTLAHCALLEPDLFAARYVVAPAGLDGRTKEGKAWKAENAGREIVTHEQRLTAERQAAAVRALPEVAQLLTVGAPEVSAFWTDPRTGLRCKCRPDWVHESSHASAVVLLDLKTTQDASLGGFPRSIANYGYHLQADWYSRGYEAASGRMVLGFVFVCVESDYPHAAAAYMVDDVGMAKAREENDRLLQRYAECRAAGTWPGYSAGIQPIALPAWAVY